ncbi:glycosyltransferase, partial [Escherichia coli]
ASFFCMSSRFEGIGLVLIEAQACGLPLIAYDCDCGPSEVIINSENGYLIPAFNDAAYKNAMRKMIENPSLRQQFSKECKHNADVFSTESFCQAWIQLIKKISE